MSVSSIMFDSQLSWEKHIMHVFSKVTKNIHALNRFSSDFNQSELLRIAHGSIYSILCFAAKIWLNRGLLKIIKRLKVISNLTLQIVLGKKRPVCSILELHSLANMLTPEQMALHQPGYLLQKACASKAPTDLYNLAMSLVTFKERANSTMLTKNYISKVGL